MPEELTHIEQKMNSAFSKIQPDEQFSARLRAEIDQKAATPERTWNFPRFTFRLAVLSIAALLVVIVIFALGPQTLLASARALFGFIPGVGFVEESSAYHLCQPVEINQEGVTLKIERGGGSQQNLHLAGVITGLESAPNDFHLEDQNGQPVRVNGGGGGGGSQGSMNFDFDFLLPNQQPTWFFVMQPFPQNDLTLRLRFDLCPGVESTAASSAPVNPQNNYSPEGASAGGKGITYQVIQVAQNEKATGVKIKSLAGAGNAFTPRLRDFYLDANGASLPNLKLGDDLGNSYAVHSVQLINDVVDPSVDSIEFDPLSPQASKATLTIQAASLLYHERLPFQFAPGKTPKIGQTWDLSGEPGTTFSLDGFQVNLIQAQYKVENIQTAINEYREGHIFEFTVSMKSPSEDLHPACPMIKIPGTRFECWPDSKPGQWIVRVIYVASQPEGAITGEIGDLSAYLNGPWIIQWDLSRQ
jgi:hypothetical protein